MDVKVTLPLAVPSYVAAFVWLELAMAGYGIVATAIVNGRPPISSEDAVIRFLNGDVISRWADMALGL